MDFTLQQHPGSSTVVDLSLTKNTDIRSEIIATLSIPKGSFFQRPDFGMPVWRKLPQDQVEEFRQDIESCLKWLITTGRALSIKVTAEKDLSDMTRVNIKIEAQQPDGLIITYTFFKPIV